MSRSTSTKPLGHYVQTSLSPERIDRNWNAIERALPKPRRQFRFAPLVAAAAMCALAALLVVRPWGANNPAIEGALLRTGVGEEQTVELGDGSRIVLEALTQLRIVRASAQDVRLQVERGGIELEVTHVEGRKFTVAAGGVEVGVVGTKFHVGMDADDNEVTVAVAEGKVLVARKDGGGDTKPRYLVGGESWTAPANIAPVPAPPQLNPPAAPIAKAPAAPKSLTRSRTKLSRRFHQLFESGKYDEAFAEVSVEELGALGTLDAADLFRFGQVAGNSGHPQEAALAFDAVRTKHPSDANAGLAALQLGRLRLEDLNEPAAAKEALDDALRLNPKAFYREDAEARRVQALDEMGDREGCVAARDAYLASYPQGIRAVSIARRCR
jgi:transmembrane sensor